jgi:hypothetical protein
MKKKNGTVKTTKKKTTTKAVTKGKLGSLLGHSVISVVRAMGKTGWDFEAAKAALDKAGVKAATRTIQNALRRGKQNDGSRRIAPLSAKQLATLKA